MSSQGVSRPASGLDGRGAWAFRTDGSLAVAWSAASGAHQVDTTASVLSLDAKVHTATICPPTPTMLTAPATAAGSLSSAPVAPTVLPLAP